jgi:NTP pyrophosphatase (non-canonical NTP hydrolase)
VDLGVLQADVVAFAHDREWEQFHDAKNLAMALASEVGELNAIFRWVPTSDVEARLLDDDVRRDLGDEIGDVGILLLLLCQRTGVDLGTAVLNKLASNAKKYPLDKARGKPDAP